MVHERGGSQSQYQISYRPESISHAEGDAFTLMRVNYRPVELILMRQLASYLATPIFLVDAGGTLVFYNEAAEGLLGRRFEDLPEMGRDEWLLAFQPHQPDGSPLSPDDNPLPAALADGREHHRTLAIIGLDGRERQISVTAFPLVGQAGRMAGAVAVFWPSDDR